MANAVKKLRVGLYPGTFSPVTNGHLDLIARAARLLDKLVVGVAVNTGKGPLFELEERVELVEAEIARIATENGMVIEVHPFDTLLIDYRPQGRRQHDRARVACSHRLRLRVSDGWHELPHGAGCRDGVSDGERAAPVHRLPPGEGGGDARRRHFVLRPAADP